MFIPRIRRFVHWLLIEPLAVYTILIGVALSFGITYLFNNYNGNLPEKSASLLQLIGTITLTLTILRRRSLFRFPSFKDSFVGWLKRFPVTRKPKHYSETLESTVKMEGKLRMFVTRNPPVTAPVEKRIAALFENFQELKKLIDIIEEEMSQRLNYLQELITSERKEREITLKRIDELLKDSVGDTSWELIGLSWLIIGLIIASIVG